MSGLNALSVRDLVALTVIATRTLHGDDGDPDKLVAEAFGIADAFVTQSESYWSEKARANHKTKRSP